MTSLSYLAATAVPPTRLDPWQLFLDADIVVKVVLIGLIVASIWSWTIIIGFLMRAARLKRRNAQFEEDFWGHDDPEKLISTKRASSTPSARVAKAGMDELRLSTSGAKFDREGTRLRVAQAMEGQVAAESDRLADRLNFLATTGSVAPFVGLFGTVWGIMNSFFQIGSQQNSSLAVVAPGISEALFATAVGLFAAIPAVVAYNRFNHTVNGIEAGMQRFGDRVHAQISREMDGA
ncbi:protein TolQ [Altericroceibacterium endophyticum]|uniref:Protein TolQ n=1 Tax=Altericroceibacterium endophyticum TaxID=1808508 RepID=A0A6I4T7L3_9SPHN|nr:protein TolQ [Altericroceibacterium endophyticum]MXO66946.1 protein TolQ [Altericroceibacterium endophyticum]